MHVLSLAKQLIKCDNKKNNKYTNTIDENNWGKRKKEKYRNFFYWKSKVIA